MYYAWTQVREDRYGEHSIDVLTKVESFSFMRLNRLNKAGYPSVDHR